MQNTIIDKIWDSHVVKELGNGDVLLHIDRNVVLDLGSNVSFDKLKKAGRHIRNPSLTFAIQDHTLATDLERNDSSFAPGEMLIKKLRKNANEANIKLFDIDDPNQGIVHIVTAEQGIVLPGLTFVAGDSHSSTPGGVGCFGFGIGTSEQEHVLATQTLLTHKPKRMQINFDGKLAPHVTAKDMVLYLIGKISAEGGTGHAVEYAGQAIRSLQIEGRLTICNMSIEFGARVGLVAPDETTFNYLKDLPYSPKGQLWDEALTQWHMLQSDNEALFDKEVSIDASDIEPQITWGTSPMDVISITGVVPDVSTVFSGNQRKSKEKALSYMDLEPGSKIEGTKIDWAFIGSCTNSRLSDLVAAADVLKGRKVADGVHAMVVPGSMKVKSEAEALGLDKVFKESGFDWRASACSLCAGANSDVVGPGQRCISSTNRNFEGRQGDRARTHLASPPMVAAAAVTGCITDVRKLVN